MRSRDPQPASNAVADNLAEARKLIEQGWTRGNYSQHGRYCMVGAVRQVMNGEAWLGSPAATDALGPLQIAVGRQSLLSWNDAQKSKKSVLAAFDKAIELARKAA